MAKNTAGKKKGKIIFRIVMIALIAVIAVSAFQLIRIFSNYRKSNALYDNLDQEYVVNTDNDDNEAPDRSDTKWYKKIKVDVAGLQKQNPDCAGWLYVENSKISYPVMNSGDDEKYLHHAFDGSYAFAGCLFMEGTNNADFQDSYSIIYGHNMRNLSMFGRLRYYRQQKSYYKNHAYFQIITKKKQYRYHIFAYDQVLDTSSVYQTGFGQDKVFKDFIQGLRSNAEYNNPKVKVTKHDKVIVLSTCYTGNYRTVVYGVREDTHDL